MKRFNLSQIMRKAWGFFKKGTGNFAECLHRAWINAKLIADAKEKAGISEAVNTWAGWRDNGCMVAHGSKCLFQVKLVKHDGKSYTASYFGQSQIMEG